MWIERTPAEKQLVARHRSLRRIGVSSLAFVVTTLFLCFIRGGFEAAPKGSYFVPISDTLQRIPFAIIFGIATAILCFLLFERKSVLICPQCESSKNDDSHTACACGGRFQRIEDIKWISGENIPETAQPTTLRRVVEKDSP